MSQPPSSSMTVYQEDSEGMGTKEGLAKELRVGQVDLQIQGSSLVPSFRVGPGLRSLVTMAS